MKTIVKVTNQDIQKGIPRAPCQCPIALATNRAFNCDGSSMTMLTLFVGELWAFGPGVLPDEVVEFRKRFDGKMTVEPFEFVLEHP